MNILLIITVWVLLFHKALFYGLVIDDINRENNKQSKGLTLFLESLRCSNVGYSTKKYLFFDHLVSLVIHLIATLLINNYFGVLTALLFLVHPNCLQVAVWLNGKRYGIGTIIALIGLNFPIISGISLFSGAWQASTLGAGVISALYNFNWSFLIILVALFHVKHFIAKYKSREKMVSQYKTGNERFILSAKLYGRYFFNTILPTQPAMFYPEIGQFDLHKTEKENAVNINNDFYLGVLAIVSTLILVYYYPLFIWFPLSIIGYLHLQKRHPVQNFADRYIYCGQIVLLYIISQTPLALFFAGYYFLMTSLGMVQYKNMETFLEYNVKLYPNCSRIAYFYALKQWENGNLPKAYVFCKDSLVYNPNNFDLLFLFARINNDYGQIDKAVYYLTKAKNCAYYGQEEKLQKRCDKILEEIKNAQ
jgi:hypothetical protein